MKHLFLPLLLVIVASASVIWVILESGFSTGTLLYIIVPFAISVVLYFLMHQMRDEGRAKAKGIWWDYANHMLIATIVFFATSGLLMEGFLCVLMFMPIYYFFVTLGYLFSWLALRKREKDDINMFAYALPVLVMMLASEGLVPSTTVPRDKTATYIMVTDQSVAQLKLNMAAPISFPAERNWFLRLFPIPDEVSAGTLVAGDIHNLHFTYKKWIFGNYQSGEMDIKTTAVEPLHIQTEILRNTSYFSHYAKIHGTDVAFTPLADGQTQVSLTVKYERLLDPAWYFGPMQDYATKQSAKYLVENVIVRENAQSQ